MQSRNRVSPLRPLSYSRNTRRKRASTSREATQRPSYVLTIVGSDVPANEAAARFLTGDELPQELQFILKKQNLRSFELLLRGHHLHGESNDKLTIIACRVTNR